MIRALLPLFCLLLSVTAHAQDTLVLRTGREHVVKVLEINPTEVIYKRFDNLEGPNIIVLKADVAHIVYANGTREEFEEEAPRVPTDRPVVARSPEARSWQKTTCSWSWAKTVTCTLLVVFGAGSGVARGPHVAERWLRRSP